MILRLAFALMLLAGGAFAKPPMVPGAEHAEWRAIGRVNVAGYNSRTMCSGTLIAPDLVLTAAHCVVDPKTGAPFRPANVRFAAGWFRGKAYTHGAAVSIAVLEQSETGGHTARFAADIALFRLGRPLEARGLEPLPVAALPRGTDALTAITYRADRPHALSRAADCPITGADPRLLLLACDVTFGASGGPLFEMGPEGPRLVAVLSAMRRQGGQITAIAVRAAPALERLREKLGAAE